MITIMLIILLAINILYCLAKAYKNFKVFWVLHVVTEKSTEFDVIKNGKVVNTILIRNKFIKFFNNDSSKPVFIRPTGNKPAEEWVLNSDNLIFTIGDVLNIEFVEVLR